MLYFAITADPSESQLRLVKSNLIRAALIRHEIQGSGSRRLAPGKPGGETVELCERPQDLMFGYHFSIREMVSPNPAGNSLLSGYEKATLRSSPANLESFQQLRINKGEDQVGTPKDGIILDKSGLLGSTNSEMAVPSPSSSFLII